jgi:hypothetical protein
LLFFYYVKKHLRYFFYSFHDYALAMANSTNTTEGYAPFDLYPYNPAQPPAFAFLGLFAAAGFLHIIFMFPYRAAFPIPMIIGSGSMFPSTTRRSI